MSPNTKVEEVELGGKGWVVNMQSEERAPPIDCKASSNHTPRGQPNSQWITYRLFTLESKLIITPTTIRTNACQPTNPITYWVHVFPPNNLNYDSISGG